MYGIGDVKSDGEGDERDGISVLYFLILNRFCFLVNISMLIVINIKGRLIREGKVMREIGKESFLWKR